ncbi:UNVERIFIED_CONTAM: hypothetical protein FKN15_051871 [Acipenser sinensis]
MHVASAVRIHESAALGAAGVVLWGSSEYGRSKSNCLAVKKYIDGPLGHYIINVTSAAKLCSKALCKKNGKCIWKSLDSGAYLHLNPRHFKIRNHFVHESAALGAAGVVLWGSSEYGRSKHNCSKVKLFMSYELGLYITNVTKAAEVCSEFLCQNNGRCVRKDWQALHYLHLNPNSYMIQPSEEGEFIVTGQASSEELSDLREKFSCHCYQGHGGQKCDILDKPGKPDSSTTKPFNSVVTVFLLSIVNLIV